MILPLTDDSKILETYINALTSQMMPLQGDEPVKALNLATDMLKNEDVPGTILFITDEMKSNSWPAFSDSVHQIAVLAIGTEKGGPVPSDDNSFVLGDTGAPVTSVLDKENLKKFGRESKAYVTTVTLDNTDVERVHSRIRRHLAFVQDQMGKDKWKDFGYYLVYPLAAMVLFWFRKGWTIQWAAVFIFFLLLSPGTAQASEFSFMDLWMTADQQGRYYFEKQNYEQAANRFEDPLWKGVAHYLNEDFKGAATEFSKLDSPQSYFNLGNALAHHKKYVTAVKIYTKALALKPDFMEAQENRQRIQGIIDRINEMSERNKPESGGYAEKVSGMDMADGFEEQTEGGALQADQFNADELQDDNLEEVWMRRVTQNPATFLSMKFDYQLKKEQH
jgi:Ca-activated chloride channel family protein